MSDLTIIRGDDATFEVAVSSEGDSVSVEDALAVTFSAKRSTRDADIDALIRKDLDDGVSVDVAGIHVTITADDSRDLAAPVVLIWDVELIDEAGLTHTVAGGYLRIEADVTRSSGFVAGSGS